MGLNMMNDICGMINLPFQGEAALGQSQTQGVAIGLK